MGKSNRLKKNRQKTTRKVPTVLIKTTPSTRRTLGLAMIMKDEIEDLERIVHDYGKYFDKIYVTVTNKKTYTSLQKSAIADLVELTYFEWIDHFGKARNYNLDQVKTDYWMWIDLDDEIEGAEKLHQVVEYMDANNLDAVWFQYDYIRHVNSSEPSAITWRERIIRTGSGLKWKDEPIHESIQFQNGAVYTRISEADVRIQHRQTAEHSLTSGERNRIILEKDWRQKPRDITAHYLGRDFLMLGDHRSAIEKYLFVTRHSKNINLRFDAWENLCECYFQIGDYPAALAAANEGMAIDPNHPGPWYERFAVYRAMGNDVEAFQSAEIALSKQIEGDHMRVSLYYDPSWYQYRAPFNVARAYLSLGNTARAYELYSEVKRIAPEYVEEQSAVTGVQWNDVFEQAMMPTSK